MSNVECHKLPVASTCCWCGRGCSTCRMSTATSCLLPFDMSKQHVERCFDMLLVWTGLYWLNYERPWSVISASATAISPQRLHSPMVSVQSVTLKFLSWKVKANIEVSTVFIIVFPEECLHEAVGLQHSSESTNGSCASSGSATKLSGPRNQHMSRRSVKRTCTRPEMSATLHTSLK